MVVPQLDLPPTAADDLKAHLWNVTLGGTTPTLVSTLGRDLHTDLLHLADINSGEPRGILAGKLIGSVATDSAGAMVAHDGDLVFFNVADGRLIRRFRPYEQGRAWHDLDGSR